MNPIQQMKNALRASDVTLFAQAVHELIVTQPTEWESILLEFGTPDPHTAEFTKALEVQIGAFESLANVLVEGEDLRKLRRHLAIAGIFKAQLMATDDEFHRTKAWAAPPMATIWRMCAYVESQHLILNKATLAQATKKGYLDAYAANATFLKDENTGTGYDFVTQAETVVEIAEMVIRSFLYKSAIELIIDTSLIETPYEDKDFAIMLRMVGRWILLVGLWHQIKYEQWEYRKVNVVDPTGEERECLFFSTPDSEDLLRRLASYKRRQIYHAQEIVARLAAHASAFTNTRGRLNQLAYSITLPPVGDAWNGKLDHRVLANVVEYTDFHLTIELFVDREYQHEWIFQLYNKGLLPIKWNEYVHVRNCLVVIARAFQIAAERQVAEADGHGCLRLISRIRRADLVKIIAKATRFSQVTVDAALSCLIFDPKRRGMEWWDQPLVPIGAADLLLVPTVIINGDPTRTLENLIASSGPDISRRSQVFETDVARTLKDLPDCSVRQGLKFDAFDGRPIEFDVLAYWKGFMLLIEAKCLRSVTSPYEDRRARKDVVKSIEQLRRRRKSLDQDWEKIRQLSPGLALPAKFVGYERTICIGVNNLMRFSGMCEDDIIITDAMCLRRFFSEDPLIVGIDPSIGIPQKRVFGRIRKGEKPDPAELMSYLKAPPQIRSITEQFTEQDTWVLPTLGLVPMCFESLNFAGRRPRL